MPYAVSREIEENLAILAGSLSERDRRKALLSLASSRNGDGSRLLMELFRLTPWSPLRCQILRAIGNFSDLRTTEFLYRQALGEEDLTTAREAVLSLGQSPHPLAQEILLSLATAVNFPFRREAVHALGCVPVLTVGGELIEFVSELQQHGPVLDPDQRILHTLVTVLADHGVTAIERDLVSLLEREAAKPVESGLLHACLLAAGSVATPLVRSTLETLDLDDKTLGASLRSTALRLAEAEGELEIEDALDSLKSFVQSDDSSPVAGRRRSLALSRFARFSIEDLREASDLFSSELNEIAKNWLETLTFDGTMDGRGLLERALKQKDPFLLSSCAKQIKKVQSTKSWVKILSELCADDLAVLALVIRDSALLDQLLIQAPRIRDEKTFTAICNGLVAQVQMTFDQNLTLRVLECLESIAFKSGRRIGVIARALRAVGQIAFEGRVPREVHEAVMGRIETVLVGVSVDSPRGSSAIHALGSAPSETSLRILERAIEKELEQDGFVRKCSQLLNALMTFPEHLLSEFNLTVGLKTLEMSELQNTFLRLMGLGVTLRTTEGQGPEGLVHVALSSESFSEILLGLDAAAQVSDGETQDLIYALASHEDETVRSLAIERICRSRKRSLQDRLVEIFRPSFEGKPELILRCIDSFEIDPTDPPIEFAEYFKSLCSGDDFPVVQSPFRDSTVRTEALALCDQILVIGRNRDEAPFFKVELDSLPGVDASLLRDLPGYVHYSDTLKSVLRNAELPFCYPEIFDETVDKSTAVIEFVKSIDLLLQERVGEPLFLGSRPEVLAKLRTRVARLGLHEPSENNERTIELLELGGIFTPELFPSIKLGRLVQSVLAGRFVTEQVRILDGLKGWSVFLVLFARSFHFGGLSLEAVLPVKAMPGQRVARLAWELIQLQEKRNTAAHRGTILRSSELNELRRTSVSVLAALDEIFPCPQERMRSRSAQRNRGAA